MKKVVSFCLWGNNPHYIEGAFTALASALERYPGWEPWIYLAEDVAENVAAMLASKGAIIIRMNRQEWDSQNHKSQNLQFLPAFWRFLPASDPNVEILLVRDLDSPITFREVAAVNEWISSDKPFHIMRDHPKHEYPILAGMWGCRTKILRDMAHLVRKWKRFDYYGCDQKFLGTVVYPRIHKQVWVHSECIMFPGEFLHPFPASSPDVEFIGISHTGDDERLHLQLRYLREWIETGKPVYLRPLPWSFWGVVRMYSRGKWPKNKSFPAIAP
jgi:hypothetical protein